MTPSSPRRRGAAVGDAARPARAVAHDLADDAVDGAGVARRSRQLAGERHAENRWRSRAASRWRRAPSSARPRRSRRAAPSRFACRARAASESRANRCRVNQSGCSRSQRCCSPTWLKTPSRMSPSERARQAATSRSNAASPPNAGIDAIEVAGVVFVRRRRREDRRQVHRLGAERRDVIEVRRDAVEPAESADEHLVDDASRPGSRHGALLSRRADFCPHRGAFRFT